jgi:hypothetical protein
MRHLFFIVFALLVLAGCKKDSTKIYASQGTILGVDNRYCINCGGIEIAIKNDTTKNAPAFYKINSSKSTTVNLGSNPKFPINVALDWKHDDEIYGGNYIIVTRIKILN